MSSKKTLKESTFYAMMFAKRLFQGPVNTALIGPNASKAGIYFQSTVRANEIEYLLRNNYTQEYDPESNPPTTGEMTSNPTTGRLHKLGKDVVSEEVGGEYYDINMTEITFKIFCIGLFTSPLAIAI